MLRPIDAYFVNHDEPHRSCLQFLRQYLIGSHPDITEEWKYRMPFYCLKKKMFCYLWVHKKFGQPYIGFVNGKELNHPDLLSENRARMKILLIDPGKDIPVLKIKRILGEALAICS